VEVAHGVDGTAPAVDGLAAVSDQDALGVVLAVDDGGHHRVGVLGLVQQHVVGRQSRVRELPELEVAVVGEPQPAVRVRQVRPGTVGQRDQGLKEDGDRCGVVQVGWLGDVPGFNLGGVGVAEAGDGLHDQAGDLLGGEQPYVGDGQRPSDAERLGGLASGHAGPVEAVGEAVADGPERQ